MTSINFTGDDSVNVGTLLQTAMLASQGTFPVQLTYNDTVYNVTGYSLSPGLVTLQLSDQ